MVGKHSPVRLTQYFEIHDTVLRRLEDDGVVTGNTLTLIRQGSGLYKITGLLRIRDRFILTVNKTLKVTQKEGERFIQSIYYEYNLSLEGIGNIFRYDNAHVQKGHTDPYHVHRFDIETQEELPDSPFEIRNLEDWPTLGEVIEEADTIYWENYGNSPG